jgi:hypothetical protein
MNKIVQSFSKNKKIAQTDKIGYKRGYEHSSISHESNALSPSAFFRVANYTGG